MSENGEENSSQASDASTEQPPPSPEQIEESNNFKLQANKKFQENHHEEAIDLYSK